MPHNQINCILSSDAGTIIDDFDPQCIECDGSFPSHEGLRVGIAESSDVIIEKKIGDGRIVITSVHEFPSRRFLKNFSVQEKRAGFNRYLVNRYLDACTPLLAVAEEV